MIEQWMWVIWLCVFVAALIIEASGPEVVSIWFAGGALISLVISFIEGVPWWIEAIVFAVVSAALLIFVRPMLSKLIKRDIVSSNADAMTGKKGTITEDISELKSGEVNVDGVIWTAISTKESDTIVKGTVVKVLSIDGNKLVVTPVK